MSDAILYNYSTTFVLPTDVDLESVVLSFTLASDNSAKVLINGDDTRLPQLQDEFLDFTTFSVNGLDAPFFTVGTNTLTFSVENGPGYGPNPTGLLITSISGSFGVVPEPSTLILGLVGLSFVVRPRRSRRRRSSLNVR